ncbi:MAG TPA: hypothetical protein VFP36_10545 [Usitatibacter sp.]|nr:hypothetical protein [Usitatibacter sp.]
MKRSLSMALCVLACGFAHEAANAHGFAGKRFFPATMATEDPFVADELSLPTVSRRKLGASDESPATMETAASVDYSKRVTLNLGIGFGATYLRQHDDDGAVRKGFDNFAANVKYQFYRNDEREAIMSAGVDWDIGNTGAKRIGAESFSTVTPAVFFGKGFGDLPAGARYLRPFALTGGLALSLPSRSSTTTTGDDGDPVVERHPHVAHAGFALQYSIPYLQSFVKDVGLREPFNRIIPVVEVDLQKPVNRGAGPTTGTVNPGILWAGRQMQLGIEAVIPVNSRTGGRNGVLLQLHFFLDDLLPGGAGAPIFR